MYACTKKPITNPKELERAIQYEPRMPESFKDQVKKRLKIIKEALGEDGILGVWAPHGPL